MDAPIGYVARNLFVVTLSDPAKVEPLISNMLEVGVNHVNGVEFQTTQFKHYRESARKLALTAAKEKAEKMAAVLDCTIGKPLSINENAGRRVVVLLQLVRLGLRAVFSDVAERGPGHARTGRRGFGVDGPGQDRHPRRRVRGVRAEGSCREALK